MHRQQLEDLRARQAELAQHLETPVESMPDVGKLVYLHEQRLKLKQLYNQLSLEKNRKQDIQNKSEAMRTIKARLGLRTAADGLDEQDVVDLMLEF